MTVGIDVVIIYYSGGYRVIKKVIGKILKGRKVPKPVHPTVPSRVPIYLGIALTIFGYPTLGAGALLSWWVSVPKIFGK